MNRTTVPAHENADRTRIHTVLDGVAVSFAARPERPENPPVVEIDAALIQGRFGPLVQVAAYRSVGGSWVSAGCQIFDAVTE